MLTGAQVRDREPDSTKGVLFEPVMEKLEETEWKQGIGSLENGRTNGSAGHSDLRPSRKAELGSGHAGFRWVMLPISVSPLI